MANALTRAREVLRSADWGGMARSAGSFLSDPLGSPPVPVRAEVMRAVSGEISLEEISSPMDEGWRVLALTDYRDIPAGVNTPLLGKNNALLSRDLALCDSAVHGVTTHIAQTFAAVATDGLRMIREMGKKAGTEARPRNFGPGETLSMLRGGGDSVLGDPYSFWETMAYDLLFDGNAYFLIHGGRRSGVRELERLEPRLVRVRYNREVGDVFYDGTRWGGKRDTWASRDILHIANARLGTSGYGANGAINFGTPGTGGDNGPRLFTNVFDLRVGLSTSPGIFGGALVGSPPLRAVSSVLEINRAGELHVRDFFTGAAARSNTLLLTQGKMTDTQMDSLERRIAAGGKHGGRAPDVVPYGNRIQVVQLKNEAQNKDLRDLREFGIQEVCRHYNYPARFMLPDKTPAKALEADQRNFWQRSVKPIADRVAAALTAKLLPTGYSISFNELALLRSDFTSFANLARVALGSSQNTGFMSVDELRALQGFGPTGEERDQRIARPEDFQNTGGAPPGNGVDLPVPDPEGDGEEGDDDAES